MFNISEFIENKINNIVNKSVTMAVKLASPNNLTDPQIEQIANIILSSPKISKKLEKFQSVVFEQAEVSSIMAVNAVIGLIPVPIIPGMMRTTNNVIFQIMKTLARINELNDIKKETIKSFNSNQELIQLLNDSGVDAQQIKNKLDNLDFKEIIPLVEQNLKTGVRSFTEPVKNTMQNILDAPENVIDTIGNIAEGVTQSFSENNNLDSANTPVTADTADTADTGDSEVPPVPATSTSKSGGNIQVRSKKKKKLKTKNRRQRRENKKQKTKKMRFKLR